MMWGYDGSMMGWAWFFGLLTLIGLITLIVLAVRLSAGSNDRKAGPGTPPPATGLPTGPAGRSRARQILDERFAAGDLTAEQYREQVRELGEDGP